MDFDSEPRNPITHPTLLEGRKTPPSSPARKMAIMTVIINIDGAGKKYAQECPAVPSECINIGQIKYSVFAIS